MVVCVCACVHACMRACVHKLRSQATAGHYIPIMTKNHLNFIIGCHITCKCLIKIIGFMHVFLQCVFLHSDAFNTCISKYSTRPAQMCTLCWLISVVFSLSLSLLIKTCASNVTYTHFSAVSESVRQILKYMYEVERNLNGDSIQQSWNQIIGYSVSQVTVHYNRLFFPIFKF